MITTNSKMESCLTPRRPRIFTPAIMMRNMMADRTRISHANSHSSFPMKNSSSKIPAKINKKFIQILSVYDFPTVWMENLSVHITRIFTCQKQKARCYFVGHSGAFHGNVTSEFRNLFGIKSGNNQRGPNGTGRDTVHANSFFDEVHGEASRKRNNGTFGSGIINQFWT